MLTVCTVVSIMENEFAEVTGTDFFVTVNYDNLDGFVSAKEIAVPRDAVDQYFLGQKIIVLV